MQEEKYIEKTQQLGNHVPRVSIGLPAYNGEKYLEEAICSILAQTYTDFELIISDNASTDDTQEICCKYAAKDSRVHYYRNEKNLGAAKNFNRVFELASGEYFKWAAHDDVLAPKYLQKCVSVLDKDPSVVLCYSQASRIDEHGVVVGTYDRPRDKVRLDLPRPYQRFGYLISFSNPCWLIFGVMRARSLALTSLFRNYIAADRNLLAEIGLIGRMYKIPEYLFFRRDHPEAYTRMYCQRDFAISINNYREQVTWWSSSGSTRFPWWKSCFDYFATVQRAQLEWRERLLCYSQIYRWLIREGFMAMGSDLENVFLRHSRFGRMLASVAEWILRSTVIPIVKKMSG